mmetsp:Transcript_5781/g.17045  ORF Transcript_5781/g.17045 Transcript_5781/m.17045 type:complete len:872 (+) Transcript_5781:92-2707(+)
MGRRSYIPPASPPLDWRRASVRQRGGWPVPRPTSALLRDDVVVGDGLRPADAPQGKEEQGEGAAAQGEEDDGLLKALGPHLVKLLLQLRPRLLLAELAHYVVHRVVADHELPMPLLLATFAARHRAIAPCAPVIPLAHERLETTGLLLLALAVGQLADVALAGEAAGGRRHGDRAAARLEVEMVALVPLGPVAPLAVHPVRREAGHAGVARPHLLQRRLAVGFLRARLAAVPRVLLDRAGAVLGAELARRGAGAPLGPLLHEAVLLRLRVRPQLLAAVGVRAVRRGVAPLGLLQRAVAALAIACGVLEDGARPGVAPVAVGGAGRVGGPVAEHTVLVDVAVAGVAAVVVQGGALRRDPAPGLLGPQIALALLDALATGGRASAPLGPVPPLAVDATLRLAPAVGHRRDLVRPQGSAELSAAAGHGLDLAHAPLVADAADVRGRHAGAPLAPVGPPAVHDGIAGRLLAVVDLDEHVVAAIHTCERGLRDPAPALLVALAAGHGARGPRVPGSDLARGGGAAGVPRAARLAAGRSLEERALAREAARDGAILDVARARVLPAAAGDGADAPLTPCRQDAILRLVLTAARCLLQRVLAGLPLARGAVQDEAGAVVLAGVGRRVLATAAAAPGGPGAHLAVPAEGLLLHVRLARHRVAGVRHLQGILARPAVVRCLLRDLARADALAAAARLVALRPVAPVGDGAVDRRADPGRAGGGLVQHGAAALPGVQGLLGDAAAPVLLVVRRRARRPIGPLRDLAVLAVAVRWANLRGIERALAGFPALVVGLRDGALALAEALAGGLRPLGPVADHAVLGHAGLGAGRVPLAGAQVHDLAVAVLLLCRDGQGVLGLHVLESHAPRALLDAGAAGRGARA